MVVWVARLFRGACLSQIRRENVNVVFSGVLLAELIQAYDSDTC